MGADEDGRAQAITRYRIASVLFGVMSVPLLVCAILAAAKYPIPDGLPYFIGGFIVGVLAIAQALLCWYIAWKGPQETEISKMNEVRCAMTVQSILSMLMLMGCIMGTAIAGIMGLSFGKDQAENIDAVRALAAVILVLCLATLGVIVFGLCIGCTFGVHFGVVRTRRRGDVIIINNGTAGFAPGGGFNGTGTGHGNQTIFTTSGDMVTIQEQNRILQDQIRLLQQQQQGGGYQLNAPPPAYGAMY